MVEPPPSEAAAAQAAERARRMRSPFRVVSIYECFLKDSFNTEQVARKQAESFAKSSSRIRQTNVLRL